MIDTQPLADDVYAVILAGGSGTRFWPKSRHLTPKQLTAIGDNADTMLETTLKRLDGFLPPERRIIVTHKDQAPKTAAIAGDRVAAVVGEPEARNTANALALAALEVRALAAPRGYAKPVMTSFHADHVVRDLAAFHASLRQAVAVARDGLLTLLAIKPEYPETGFGYIERGPALAAKPGGFRVKSFREKPALDLAREFVASGRFFWNAGLFVWRTDVLLDELARALPTTVSALAALLHATPSFTGVAPEALARVYASLPKISIDHAVLEVSKNVAMVEADIGWQDVGSWSALARVFAPDEDGNLLFGDGCLIDARGTTVETDGPFVAALGVKDMIVVAHRGAVLVCPKERDQDVKKVVAWLTDRGRLDLV